MIKYCHIHNFYAFWEVKKNWKGKEKWTVWEITQEPTATNLDIRLHILQIVINFLILHIFEFVNYLCTNDEFPGGSDHKASAYNVEYPGSVPGLGRLPGEGNGNPLEHACLENPTDGEAW